MLTFAGLFFFAKKNDKIFFFRKFFFIVYVSLVPKLDDLGSISDFSIFCENFLKNFHKFFFLTGPNGGFGFELSTSNYKLANETKILTFSQIFSIFDFFLDFVFSGWGIGDRLLAKAR